ncbi:MAG: SUMF1/EgtB/PvdO family nonheme iron enzyme [Deltaproteobacteria bacterium]|nr:SUMF1/EgtB/PvdO family nonheme iron enzyme [Deltaproteobacteria bacterium]
MSASLAPELDLSGHTLRPGLRLEHVIARGSFGVVYRAMQVELERPVAVKVLHAAFAANDDITQLFWDEIHAISKIKHRNVVEIHDAELTSDGRLFFIMELLEGKTLEELGQAGPLAPVRAVSIISQLLAGLAAVHATGRIHADVKPSNVIVVDEAEGGQRVVLIDFGLSRSRGLTLAEAVGGTPPFMAPEQLRDWKVEPRSDVFSAALVLVWLLCRWRRRSPDELAPSLDIIDDPTLRLALERALEPLVEERVSVGDFTRMLVGGKQADPLGAPPPPPFRHLAPLTESDRFRLQGREQDVLRVVRQLDAKRALLLMAPTGIGKTSLLRAGVAPYLEARGAHVLYVDCTSATRAIVSNLDGEQVVVIFDQAELLRDSGLLDAALQCAGASVIVSVREDLLARLLELAPTLQHAAQVRLHALGVIGARAAIVHALTEHDISIDPDLLDALVRDLLDEHALGDEEDDDTVYPPHLQLVGAALFAALGPKQNVLTLEHYRNLGGFAAIAGEYLDRRLVELSRSDRKIARALFGSLMTAAGARAFRSEVELFSVSVGSPEVEIRKVLQRLHDAGLVVRRIGPDGEPTYELIHDTLVPRVRRWLEVQDLDRQRAAELLRFHLRRCRDHAPSLLTRDELHEVERFPDLVPELEREWTRRLGVVWTPTGLVERSRQVARYRRGVVIGGTIAVAALAFILVYRWLIERNARREEASLRAAEATLRDRDLGRFVLELAPFEWDANRLLARNVPIERLPHLRWRLLAPRDDDPDEPGEELPPERFQRDIGIEEDGIRRHTVEARGGDAFLEITGRGVGGEVCEPSIIPLRFLPGHGRRNDKPLRSYRIRVPTCSASRAGMISIDAGPFIFGGRGVPQSTMSEEDLVPRTRVVLSEFRIDRTEVTNAAFAVFTEMKDAHQIWGASYAQALEKASRGSYPRVDVSWSEARAYCRFLGNTLPSSKQWQRALRGPDLPSNPLPERNLPWGEELSPIPAALQFHARSTAEPVAVRSLDRSVEGVMDLAGNVEEWTSDIERGADPTVPPRLRTHVVRGGNWANTNPERLVDTLAIENSRNPILHAPFIGFRCATRSR